MTNGNRGAAAIAEMSPFSRPALRNTSIPSGWRNAAPMEVSGDGNLLSTWQPPTYPLVGFDPGTFLSQNKVAVALGLAVLAGGITYYYGFR